MFRSRKIRSGLRRALPLLRAGEGRGDLQASESEILFDLSGQNPGNLLFGRLGPEEVMGRLARAGVIGGLARRGYRDPLLVLECGDPSDQRVSLFAGRAVRDRNLFEVRLQRRRFHPRTAIGPLSESDSFHMLIIQWITLSDPDRSFTIGRPRLPGQARPGLGLLAPCLSLIEELARELALDGVLNVPDHYHTALFYSRSFRFLDPEAEGTFQAVRHTHKGVPLALLSEAIAEGCLVDQATGTPVAWKPAEQVLPLRGSLRRHFSSSWYRDARKKASEKLRPAIDWDRYREKIAAKGRSGKYP